MCQKQRRKRGDGGKGAQERGMGGGGVLSVPVVLSYEELYLCLEKREYPASGELRACQHLL